MLFKITLLPSYKLGNIARIHGPATTEMPLKQLNNDGIAYNFRSNCFVELLIPCILIVLSASARKVLLGMDSYPIKPKLHVVNASAGYMVITYIKI